MTAFDRMCGVIERHAPQLRKSAEDAALFLMGGVEVPARYDDPDVRAYLNETFFLPFPVVAVEDDKGCVVLSDTTHEQRGLTTPRFFIDTMSRDGLVAVSWGTITCTVERADSMKLAGTLLGSLAVHNNIVVGSLETHATDVDRETLADAALRNAKAALEELFQLNTPSRFVVEAAPRKQRSGKAKVSRAHERPTYTLLTPQEIRQRFGHQEPSGNERASPAPHARRRHERVLSSDRFKNKQGQRIVIPATWVGPSEATIGGRVYRVRLDL